MIEPQFHGFYSEGRRADFFHGRYEHWFLPTDGAWRTARKKILRLDDFILTVRDINAT